MKCFEMTNLGEMNYYFKIRFIYLEEVIFMSYKYHIIKTLEFLGFAKCIFCRIPMSVMIENVKIFIDMSSLEVNSYFY
jgi:hypothetical protein